MGLFECPSCQKPRSEDFSQVPNGADHADDQRFGNSFPIGGSIDAEAKLHSVAAG